MTQDSTRLSAVQRLRRVGLRATGPRLAILARLEGDRSHPTPEAILESLRPIHPSFSLSTGYTTLEAFTGESQANRRYL
jgi:Fe2+ or Zn2+ uptake regulation protein